jgi:lactate permease
MNIPNENIGGSMMQVIASKLSKVGDLIFITLSPFIGALGSFVSGSSTVSNQLFTQLQFDTALALNLTAVLLAASQSIGSAVGCMISINNMAAVSATAGIGGREGKILRINIIPLLIYLLIIVIFFETAIAFSLNPI